MGNCAPGMCELLNAQKASESEEGEGQNTDKDGLVVVQEYIKLLYIHVYIYMSFLRCDCVELRGFFLINIQLLSGDADVDAVYSC